MFIIIFYIIFKIYFLLCEVKKTSLETLTRKRRQTPALSPVSLC